MTPALLNLNASEAPVGCADRARVLLAVASSLGLTDTQRCKVGLSYKDGPTGAHAVRYLDQAAEALDVLRGWAEADLRDLALTCRPGSGPTFAMEKDPEPWCDAYPTCGPEPCPACDAAVRLHNVVAALERETQVAAPLASGGVGGAAA